MKEELKEQVRGVAVAHPGDTIILMFDDLSQADEEMLRQEFAASPLGVGVRLVSGARTAIIVESGNVPA